MAKAEKFYLFPWDLEEMGCSDRKAFQESISEIFYDEDDFPVPYYEVTVTKKFEAAKNTTLTFKEVK